jgi:succinyl-CoA synthetase beta subunit
LKLLESEAKTLLSKYGLRVPAGILVRSPAEAAKAAEQINKPVVLKAQIGVSGRGKAGGIIPARNADEAEKAASSLLGSQIKGLKVTRLLVEEKLEIERQFYLSLTIDRGARRFVILASKKGGGDIEDVARSEPESILRRWIDPLDGLSQGASEEIGDWLVKDQVSRAGISRILASLYRAALDFDAELAELNPLVRTSAGDLVAADSRLIIDDNALFRQPELAALGATDLDGTAREIEARQDGLAYVDLEGDIGIIGNGAGLVMATLDLVEYYGGKPANFLDIGGGAALEVIKNGVLLVMAKPEVRAVLINILGGITRCDQVAEGLVEALEIAPVRKTIAVRMMGTNEMEGREILLRHGLGYYPDMESAAEAILRS